MSASLSDPRRTPRTLLRLRVSGTGSVHITRRDIAYAVGSAAPVVALLLAR